MFDAASPGDKNARWWSRDAGEENEIAAALELALHMRERKGRAGEGPVRRGSGHIEERVLSGDVHPSGGASTASRLAKPADDTLVGA